MNNENICENCGCVEENLYTVEIDGEDLTLCADCLKAKGFVRCDDCGEWVRKGDSYITYDGRTICQSCYETDYFTCEHCDEIHPNEHAVTINGGYRSERVWCEDCADFDAYRCEDCGEYFTESYTHSDWRGTVVCDLCFSENWYVCADCGELVHSDDVVFGTDDQAYCSDCVDNHRASRHFHEYTYKPLPKFQFRSGETKAAHKGGVNPLDRYLTFGVELEVDKGEDHNVVSDDLASLGQPIYMKYDGSLVDEGVEIVTNPCSLAYHMYDLRWAQIAKTCRDHGYKSHDATTCGLHVHVGRRGLAPDIDGQKAVAAKLVLLAVSLNGSLTTFSRREEYELNHWAAYPRPYVEPGMTDDELVTAALATRSDGRYQAVNLCPTATVEFRLFRGTLKRDTIIATIQLVSNLVKYAQTHTPSECLYGTTFADILQVEQFKELNTYAAGRGLL